MNRLLRFWLGGVLLLLSRMAQAQDPTPVPPPPLRDSLLTPKDTTYWKKTTEIGLNLNQGSFSDNWTGGGVSSIAIGSFFNMKREYLKDRDNFVSDLQLSYGIVKNRGQQTRKSLDRIFYDAKYGRKLGAGSKWYFFANINLLSQFADGYDFAVDETNPPLISTFFTPAFLTEAIGLEYKPNKFFNLLFAPGAVRQTILGNRNLYQAIDARVPPYTFANYGVERGRSIRNEVALMQLVANFDKDIAKNVNLKWRYQAFASIQDLAAIDSRLDAQLTAKVNRFVNVSLGAIVFYDQDQSTQIQFAQTLALGLLYAF
jgi:hypothetical protein